MDEKGITMETKTSKNIISWGQLFLLIGVFALFLYALTVRVNFNPKTDVVLEGYVFVGSELKTYTRKRCYIADIIFLWETSLLFWKSNI